VLSNIYLRSAFYQQKKKKNKKELVVNKGKGAVEVGLLAIKSVFYIQWILLASTKLPNLLLLVANILTLLVLIIAIDI